MAKFLFFLIFFLAVTVACKHDYTPKPHGYFRIEFKEKSYHSLDSAALPYKFEVPGYSKVLPDKDRLAEPYWINVKIPVHKAEVHISYKKVEKNLQQLLEDSRKLAYKHTIKADAINERIVINKAKKIYGTIYEIEGNAASPLQFYLTDSTRNFLRGALYIREIPNVDSLRPVIDYLTPDVIHLIETTEWKN
ncbi:MAG TPA: gliding motility lipoprotein GldD [Prolixibacteraceae bacterium]|jgi:gliding motility-associated lipoprotein GldD|nr:gliding motility lipoprotein GldD [Prolixibacteraceae bacterium]